MVKCGVVRLKTLRFGRYSIHVYRKTCELIQHSDFFRLIFVLGGLEGVLLFLFVMRDESLGKLLST